jgi:competence protein ComEC
VRLVSPSIHPDCRAYTLLPVIFLVACLVSSGCTIPTISSHAGTNAIPPSYGLNDGRMEVYFLDVGQGDSELIRYNGTTVLIDAGEAEEGPGIVTYLKHLGISDIDLLIATHPHSDHIGGMQDILKNFNVRNVIDSGMPHTSPTYQKFLETIDRKNIPYKTVKRGDSFSPAPGLTMLVLSAPDGNKDQDLNDGSIVLRASYGQINILFEADAGTATEESMMQSGLPLESQILKVAHHGSPHGTGSIFLEHVRPEAAIISVGAGNPYNHPALDTVARLEEAGALVFRTDIDGTIVVRTDGMKFSLETAKNGIYPFIDNSSIAVPA